MKRQLGLFGVILCAVAAGAEEVPKYFSRLDMNSDGKISKEEFLTVSKKQAEKKGRDFDEDKCLNNMKKKDTNVDGVVSLEEFTASMKSSK